MPDSSKQNTVRYRSLDFLGFPLYRVGTDGSVWTCRIPRHPDRVGNWKRMKCSICTGGYISFEFRSTEKKKRYLIHRLILECFVAPCPEGLECRHLDGNNQNNSLENLCWGTPKENAEDMIRLGTRKGENNGRAKLSVEDVKSIREKHGTGMFSYSSIAREYNVSVCLIRFIVLKILWKNVT